MNADVEDWPRWRATNIITVWQVGEGYDAATLSPQVDIRTPGGDTLYISGSALSPALVWYPPSQWQAGDVITVTTLPLYLPHAFGLVAQRQGGVEVEPAGTVSQSAQLIAAFQRSVEGQLVTLDTTPSDDAQALGVWLHGEMASSAAPFSARFALPGGERLVMTAVYGSDSLSPGGTVDVRLGWQAEEVQAWPQGVMAFVHLRRDGENQSQQDGLPRYFVLDPLAANGKWADWRQLRVPVGALPGLWQIVVGLYDPAQGTRLPVVDVGGHVMGDEAVLGTLLWRDAPVPDQTCALIAATCAAQVVK
jgi:hypothetical protein